MPTGRKPVLWCRRFGIGESDSRHQRRRSSTAILHQFEMADGRRIGRPDWEDGEVPDLIDGRSLTLGTLKLGEQFVYIFDLGDNWAHLRTVAQKPIHPLDELGIESLRKATRSSSVQV